MSQITAEQRDILAEVGHFHLMLESHQTAARFCRDQLKKLRQRLAEVEQALQAQQSS
jgi:uncharacterized coiled-coil protein SlyX